MTRESNRKTLLQLKDFVGFGQVHHVECDPPDWFSLVVIANQKGGHSGQPRAEV